MLPSSLLPPTKALLCALLLLVSSGNASALDYHFSTMVSSELIGGSWPGSDYTLLLDHGWGIRYSTIPHVRFKREQAVQSSGSTLAHVTAEGTYQTPLLLRLIDYRSFNAKGPFDFLTAYIGGGRYDSDIELQSTRYTASGSRFTATTQTATATTTVNTLTMGLYGGEKFVVLDVRVVYLTGKIAASTLLPSEEQYQHWMFLFSMGIGF